jgi:hypothetical protein
MDLVTPELESSKEAGNESQPKRECSSISDVCWSCASSGRGLLAQQVTYNFMPGTDLSKYHTYEWVEIPGGIHPNQIIDQEIKQAVNNTLASKGLTLATGDTADLCVGYQCAVDQEKQWNAWGTGGRLMGGMGSATSSTISNGTTRG